jgi:hypothetical protein
VNELVEGLEERVDEFLGMMGSLRCGNQSDFARNRRQEPNGGTMLEETI